MKVAIYPGSFNPWHDGHNMVVEKALRVFKKVIIAIGQNPDKPKIADETIKNLKKQLAYGIKNGCIEIITFDGLFADCVNRLNKNAYNVNAVIKGIRNSTDFEYEKAQLYWNQDLKIGIPTFFLIADRDLVHISSSAIRAIDKAQGVK